MVQFRKRKQLGPIRLTFSQAGLSTSIGAAGLRVSRGADGKVRRTVRIPGTGIYDTRVVGWTAHHPHEKRNESTVMPQSAPPAGWYPDPTGEAARRYWDGAQWTSATDTQSTTPVAPAPLPTHEPDDGQFVGMTLPEFLSADFPPETFPATAKLQAWITHIATSEESEDNGAKMLAAFESLINAVSDLELRVVNGRSYCTNLATYVIHLETRLLNAGVRLAPSDHLFPGVPEF